MRMEQMDLLLIKREIIKIHCEKHGQIEASVAVMNGKQLHDPTCPICAAESDVEAKILKQKKEKEEAKRVRDATIEANLKNAMIPLRFQNHSFDTFLEKTPEHAKRKARCLEYAENFTEISKKGTSLIFCGATGTGKTHLACSIANCVIKEHAASAVFLSTLDAVRRVKETYRKGSEETERQAIAWFSKHDLLILDEVGVQFGSDTEKMILFEIINKRYENLKPTILISNLSLKNLEDFVGERIMDRMRENGGRVLIFEFESFRKN